MDRLRAEFEASGRAEHYEVLKPFLIGETEGRTWKDASERLNLTEAAAKMAGSRMRKRYRELLRDEISQTVSGPEEIDDEIHKLFSTLGL